VLSGYSTLELKRTKRLNWRKYAQRLQIEQPVILTANASFHGRTLATITAEVPKDFSPLVPGFSTCLQRYEAVETAITELDSGDYGWRRFSRATTGRRWRSTWRYGLLQNPQNAMKPAFADVRRCRWAWVAAASSGDTSKLPDVSPRAAARLGLLCKSFCNVFQPEIMPARLAAIPLPGGAVCG